MAARVNIDAMIPRADFAVSEEHEFTLDLFQNFPISNLESSSPIRNLLRKPDFQRETNHWNPNQLVTFIASFLDNELIPSLILWKSQSYIFVIDGGHRLSALRAWMEDDYGDGIISQAFYKGEISDEQKRVAKRTRSLVESNIGKYSFLKAVVNKQVSGNDVQTRRASKLFTRALSLQWVQGTASVAETSFFKINSQGTPLDNTEEMLLKTRKTAISIGARAIVRAGTGHKYWSSFDGESQGRIEDQAAATFKLLFEPEVTQPLKTLDIPIGGAASPVDALSLLVDFLLIADGGQNGPGTIDAYGDDEKGDETVNVLRKARAALERISGNGPGSLGLHPAVYFYNEKGKQSRFMFLGVFSMIVSRLSNNDSGFFVRFTQARERLEAFLVTNKPLIGILLQNTNRNSRVSKIRELIEFLVSEFSQGRDVSVEGALTKLGAKARIFEVTTTSASQAFSDDTKSSVFLNRSLQSALKCPVCGGLLDPAKSVSYDHVLPKRDGGSGSEDNCELVHPFCNTAIKC